MKGKKAMAFPLNLNIFKSENKMGQYLSDFKERNNVPVKEIILDGTEVNENPSACYRGLGCVTANGSSRLLLDYKVQNPKAYEEIMRFLFQKDYGVGLTHIKIELGSDVNSSSGTEPASKRTQDEPADVTRGAGFQFAADAKHINPDITVDLLRWGEPRWVAKAFELSQEHGFRARYRWYKETIVAAYEVYGLKFDYISADQNETDAPDESWILYLRDRLDHDGNAPYDFSRIRLIASDEVGSNQIAGQMADNQDLRNAVNVIGLHYTTHGNTYTGLLNEAYGKEIWYSEGIAPCNVPELTTLNGESGLDGANCAIDVANRIINSYFNGKMVMYEFQPAVAAYYEGSCYAPKQLIRAWQPWSGHYVLDVGFWMSLHFSRFAKKGWMYVSGGCYGDGEEDHVISNTTHNFLSLTAPDRSDVSMIFTNESAEPRVYAVVIKNMSRSMPILNTVISRGPSGRQEFNANWFRKGRSIRYNSHKECYTVKVPPKSIMTVTSLDTDWVEGVNTFSEVQPATSTRLALPYVDKLEYTNRELDIRGCAPRYMTDQGGAFEIARVNNENVIVQKINKSIIPKNWRFRGTPLPITCFGDDRWHSYSAEVEVRLNTMDPQNYAGIGIRYNSAVTCEISSMCGYSARIYGDGTWKLMDMENVAAEGVLKDINVLDWNTVKLMSLGRSICMFVNGNFLTQYMPECIVNSGRVSLCSDYNFNFFRNIKVEPLSVQSPYVRRVDCFADGIRFNENWKIHDMESYKFNNRTSMEAQEGAEFSCDFEGTGIAIVGTAQNAEITVLVDGHTVYNKYRITECLTRQACIVIDELMNCTHNLQVYITGGAFKLDCLEIPEYHIGFEDTLLRSATGRVVREESKKMMNADQILWTMEHPFSEMPEEEEFEPKEEPEQVAPAEEQESIEEPATESEQETEPAEPESAEKTEE